MPNPGGAGFNGRRKSSVSIPAFLQATAFEEEEAEEEDFIVFADMSASMRVRLCLYDTLEAKTTSAILFAFSLYALFSEDIRLLGCPKEADLAFEVLSTIAFILFFLEMVINSVVDMERDPKYFKPSSQTWFERTCRYQGYVLGFYFWLDLVAWLSLIFDMPWLLGAIVGRLVRMARLVRFVKIYRLSAQTVLEKLVRRSRLTNKAQASSNKSVKSTAEAGWQGNSVIGAKLSERTTQYVIVAIILMLVCITFMGLGVEPADPMDALNQLLADMWCSTTAGNNASFAIASRELVQEMNNSAATPLLGLELNRIDINLTLVPKEELRLEALRLVERVAIESTKARTSSSAGGSSCRSTAFFNNKVAVQAEALYGILITTFVAFLLLLFAFLFSKDAQTYVLQPIEAMMDTVDKLARDPLSQVNTGSATNTGEYEINLLANTIEKIGNLLRIGFGEAGSRIIRRNLKLQQGGDLNVMMPGNVIHAVFSFCDIRSFAQATEALQEEIFVFVNKIASLVHTIVYRWGGAMAGAQKMAEIEHKRKMSVDSNLSTASGASGQGATTESRSSDNEEDEEEDDGGKVETVDISALEEGTYNSKAQKVNEQLSAEKKKSPSSPPTEVIRTLSLGLDLRSIEKSGIIATQALIGIVKINHLIITNLDILSEDLKSKLQDKIPGFAVKMGFGLHAGWAIEGAIGSVHKIDATYLSPDVNMTARIHTATKQYSVPVMFTGRFCQLLPKEVRDLCRRLDVVAVKGSAQPGVDCYLEGQWVKASSYLRKCIQPDSNMVVDGPAFRLYSLMETAKFTAPKDWAGFRNLVEK
eukprot:g952.t1